MSVILIIEDEIELTNILRSYLVKSGMKVLIATGADQGLLLWETEKPDLILLDLNLPGMDGLDLAREIRHSSEVPIIMVTARVEESDRLVGLELGADDYISKPYSPREVVARVKAVLRRTNPAIKSKRLISIAGLVINIEEHTVQKGDQFIELTPTEFNLLATLAGQPGRAFTRMQLLEAAQGAAYEGYERTIDAHIKNLRSKLETDPRNPFYIETIVGVGYRFHRV